MANQPDVVPVVICRCEEVSEEQIAAAYRAGYRTPEALKRKLRVGMGPCQGRTCLPLILAMVARMSGCRIEDIAPPQVRPPLKPLPLAMFAALQAADAADRPGEM